MQILNLHTFFCGGENFSNSKRRGFIHWRKRYILISNRFNSLHQDLPLKFSAPCYSHSSSIWQFFHSVRGGEQFTDNVRQSAFIIIIYTNLSDNLLINNSLMTITTIKEVFQRIPSISSKVIHWLLKKITKRHMTDLCN